MTPLATITDLQARIQRTLSGDELTAANALLTDASATVRNYTRQQITQSTTTDLCRHYGGVIAVDDVLSENTFADQANVWPAVVRLPQRPVTAVSAVTDLSGNAVDFYWDGGQLVGTVTSPVKVTYEHGWPAGDPIYDTVTAVVCSIVARALGRSPEDGSVVQESIAGYAYTVGVIGAAGAVGLLPDEKERLKVIRGRTIRSIRLFG